MATGIATAAISAALIDFSDGPTAGLASMVNSSAPTIGLALGALVSSALVQYGPSPLRLVYWVIIGALLISAVLMTLTRETRERRPGALASLKPIARVDPAARSTLLSVAPSLIALWALSGFYLSLAPTLIAGIEQSSNRLWGGAAVFSLMFAAAVATIAYRAVQSQTAILAGCVGLLAGAALLFTGIAVTNAAVFLTGSVITGAGFGLAFLGAIRAVSAVAAPMNRGGTLAVLYIVSYLAFSIPVIVAGVAETHYSAHDVALVFAAAVGALSAIGLGASVSRSARTPS